MLGVVEMPLLLMRCINCVLLIDFISSLSFEYAVGEFVFLKKRANCKKNVYSGGMKIELEGCAKSFVNTFYYDYSSREPFYPV